MRRLLNKKGSVLFLVLVVMSLLIIAASATYYIVNNQRASINVRYSSEQSYQTALSLSNSVSDYIDGYGAKLKNKQIDGKDYEDNILVKLVSLDVNQQFDATKSLADLEMGDVTVNIKKIKIGETVDGDNTFTEHVFEISTNASVNGETSTVTQYKSIVTAAQVQTAEPFTRFLTSTGKGSDPRDVYLAPATIYGNAFFENEWTTMTAHLNSSLYSSKSFVDNGIQYKTPKDSEGNKSILNWEMVIGENLVSTANAGRERLDNVFVGNDMSLDSQWNAEKVYVGGDLEIKYNDSNSNTYFVNEDLHMQANGTPNNTYYVNGDLYIERDKYGGISYPTGTVYVKGKIYYDGAELNLQEGEDGKLYYTNEWGGKVETSISHISDEDVKAAMKNKIPLSNNPDPEKEEDYFLIEDWDDVNEYIALKASQNEYMNWDAESYFLKLESEGKTASTVIPGIDNTDKTTYNNQVCTISESCRIRQGQFQTGGYATGGNILIQADTEPLYIYLEPEVGETSFRFGPELQRTNVIIEGQYPVVFILPDGTNFEMVDQSYIGHADLLLEAGGLDSVDDLLNASGSNVLNEGKMYGGDPSNVQSLFTEDSADGLLKFNTSGKTGTLHNNIFLVSNSDNATLDFNVISTFGGYIYAPKCNFLNDRASQVTAFVGGLVVSNYSYKNNMSHLIFTSPYDYYNNFTYDETNGENRGNIVDKIMSGSGGKKPGQDKGNITVVNQVKTIGYK